MPAEASGAAPMFRLGVNHWPSRTAMAWWSRFDPVEVESDFDRFAAAGLDSVRVFLLWEDFQPNARRVNRDMVGRLVAVADTAGRAGLQLMPTLFTGHMSGANLIPPWALGGTERDERFRVMSGGRIVGDGIRNWFGDEEVTKAQVRLAAEVATALAGHDALWAWDLGNESSNCVVPVDRQHGLRWLDQMTAAIRGADATALVTIGLHMEDLEQDRKLGPREASGSCDFLTMHGYPIYAAWAGGATDEHLVPFLACLTRWLGGGADVVFSEFGLPTFPATFSATPSADDEVSPMLVSEHDAARYTGRMLDRLHGAGCVGAMVWCSSDYVPAIWSDPPLDAAPHERTFGLWRSDGSAKPAVSAITASGRRSRPDPPGDDWIDIDHERYWAEPATQLPRLYRRYRDWYGATVEGSV